MMTPAGSSWRGGEQNTCTMENTRKKYCTLDVPHGNVPSITIIEASLFEEEIKHTKRTIKHASLIDWKREEEDLTVLFELYGRDKPKMAFYYEDDAYKLVTLDSSNSSSP